MNTNDQEIDAILRHPSTPKPPAGLKERLLTQIRLPANSGLTAPSGAVQGSGGWLRRWWPTLIPASISVACAALLTLQHSEIQTLKNSASTPAPITIESESAGDLSANPETSAPMAGQAAQEQSEIDRLKKMMSQLTAEVAQLEQLQAENTQLREQVKASSSALPPETQADAAAMEKKAESIRCLNNLKQLGLSVRVWTIDNDDRFPPDIICMSNEISSLKVPLCPADSNRVAAVSWASLTPANCSYQYLGATGSATEPQRVLWICPIHGHICLCDGSVQRDVAKAHPEWLIQTNGGLYYNPANSPQTAPR